jgi:bacterioferritin-associated ferredoxin
MLVCHCNVITERDIERVVTDFLDADPWQLIVPAMVLHELNKRGACCNCFPNIVDIVIRTTENYHLKRGVDEVALSDMRRRLDTMRLRHRRILGEGRSTSHRKVERSAVPGARRG